MEKISGLVLDMHDDVEGMVLRQLYPKLDDVPELYKTAAFLSSEQRDALPDDAFALVLRQGNTTLRKYACVDPGNTAINIGYFMATYHKLPIEAVKTAAANLHTACHWYDIEPPEELKKLSTGNIPVIGKQQVWKDMDGTTYSNNTQSWEVEKNAEVSGTHIMDGGKGARKQSIDPNRKRLSEVKTAEEKFVAALSKAKDAEHAGETLEPGEGLPETDQPKSLPQITKVMKPHVDVTSAEPPKLIEEKKASYYAMPSIGRYPLDGLDQLEKAAEYFYEWHESMDPVDRREYAHNLVKRANSLRKPLEQVAYDYGGEGYAKEAQLISAVDQRTLLLGPHASQGTDEFKKTASLHCLNLYSQLFDQRRQLPAEVYAGTMAEIDKLAGLDEFYGQELEDPWLSTFAKTAEEVDPKDAVVIGNQYMKIDDLVLFAQNKGEFVKNRFGDDFTSEFQQDPKGIFDSLPMDQKKVIMNMVNSEKGLQGAST